MTNDTIQCIMVLYQRDRDTSINHKLIVGELKTQKEYSMDNIYNGWKNRETWNASLWINNDEPLYRAAVEFMQNNKGIAEPYKAFIKDQGISRSKTPDGIKWIDSKMDYAALDDMMKDIID